MAEGDFLRGVLGRTGIGVFRLGFSATYRPGREAVHRALDAGFNYFFCNGFDSQSIRVLRDVGSARRQELVISTGAYSLLWGRFDLRRTLEKRLRRLKTDVLGVFLLLGVMKPRRFTDDDRDQLLRLREAGKVRAVGISTHNRRLAGELAQSGLLDVLMIRYNAAHRGAETEIFPHLATHDPGVVSYTATRWGQLARRPKGWPANEPVPSGGMAYRFALSSPHVDVCLTAPSNLQQLESNLREIQRGPLTTDELEFMRRFGDVVHGRGRWFMDPKK